MSDRTHSYPAALRLLLEKLDLEFTNPGVFDGEWGGTGPLMESISPIDGTVLGRVQEGNARDAERVIGRAQEAFQQWRETPAPVRGQIVRRLGNVLREMKAELGQLVSWETGKILTEGEGEVQEMIDICDFALGLSRQLHGLIIVSERSRHRLMEQWHPLGVVGVITAFNFPVAVWAWNSVLAAVCGDAIIWKPSEKTPLCAIAVTKMAERVCRETGAPPAIFSLLCGQAKVTGKALLSDRRIPMISATGSCAMGREIAVCVHGRLGRTLLELGGNNAVVVTPSADLDLATQAIFFGAVGTAGQRCTSTRRVIAHESILDTLRGRLLQAYRTISIGNPLHSTTLMGPLIDLPAVEAFQRAKDRALSEGGRLLHGGEMLPSLGPCYVTPCLVEVPGSLPILQEETFGPLLFLLSYRDLEEAVAMQNAVPQGLSSAIFTNDLRESEAFLSNRGSDCGIANVNTGTSGAEIGGAFGGEKDTGGGRESGSDAWKNYMRRQTNTVNYSQALPMSQGLDWKINKSQ